MVDFSFTSTPNKYIWTILFFKIFYIYPPIWFTATYNTIMYKSTPIKLYDMTNSIEFAKEKNKFYGNHFANSSFPTI